MWASAGHPPAARPPALRKFIRPAPAPPLSVPFASFQQHRRRSRQRRHDPVHSSQEKIKSLGQAIHASAQSIDLNDSNPNPEVESCGKQKQEKLKEEEAKGRALSGSDVLWALQKAVAQRNEASRNKQRQNKKRVGSSGESSEREDSGEEWRNVRPLRIKSDWGERLNDLERRLKELPETIR